MQKAHLLLCVASFTDIELKYPPNKKQYWIRIVVDGKQVFESQKRDPDSSPSWKEKSLLLLFIHIRSFSRSERLASSYTRSGLGTIYSTAWRDHRLSRVSFRSRFRG